MFGSFTPDFLNAEETSHRGQRSIQWASALADMAARNLATLPPSILAQIAARNITLEKILSRHPRFAVSVSILMACLEDD